MTDPVREEMRHILKTFEREYEDSEDMFAALQRIRRNTITDLLRVIRGHTERRSVCIGSRGDADLEPMRPQVAAGFVYRTERVCGADLCQTLESLPEEVKKSGKSE